MSLQLDLFPAQAPRASAVRHRPMYTQTELIRSEMVRHAREGQPVFAGLRTRAAVVRLLSDGEWHSWLDLCHDVAVGAYALGRIIDNLDRRQLIEQRPRYLGADELTPNTPPAKYQGFQWEYRLKSSLGAAANGSER